MNRSFVRVSHPLGAALLVGISACASDVQIQADYLVAVGQPLTIGLVTWGDTGFDTIPEIASPVVRYVSMTSAYTTVGPRQSFQFVGLSRGWTTVTFRRSAVRPVETKALIVKVE